MVFKGKKSSWKRISDWVPIFSARKRRSKKRENQATNKLSIDPSGVRRGVGSSKGVRSSLLWGAYSWGGGMYTGRY